MINKIVFRDVTIKEFEKRLITKASGKILSVLVKLEKGVDISIVTTLNEEILKVKDTGVYYPRTNITSRKEKDDTLTGEVIENDYFYFIDELLIELNAETDINGEIALRELIILYDDMEHL